MIARDMIGTKINVVGYIKTITYKDPNYTPGGFAIIKVICDEIEGDLPDELSIEWPIAFTGRTPSLSTKIPYKIVGELTESKYGPQYRIIRMVESIGVKTPEDVAKFLAYVVPEKTLENILATYPNPMDVLESKDVVALAKVKGVGVLRAEKIIEKYESLKLDGAAFVKLYDYGLTLTMVQKLCEAYGSAETVVKKIEADPYLLIYEVKGIGWIKADAIAQAGGVSLTDERRVVAYIYYLLKEKSEEQGDTYVILDDFVQEVNEGIPELNEQQIQLAILKLVKEEKLFFYPNTRRLGLMQNKQIEDGIVEELSRLDYAKVTPLRYVDDVVAECEKELSDLRSEEEGTSVQFRYSSEQLAAIRMCLTRNIVAISGRAGCVDKDTEFLSQYGWKKISDYQKGDKVMCWDSNNTAHFELPERYIKLQCDNLWLTQTKYGIDMCLSDEHTCVYYSSKGNLVKKPFSEVKKMHESSIGGFSGKFITSFKYDGPGIDLTDVEIKIMLAIICDGSFYKKLPNNKTCRFHIKKERKKIVLESLFNEAGLEYRKVKSAADGYHDYYIEAPIRTKEFDDFWYNASQHQLQLICDNILQWDGSCDSIGRRTFSSTVKRNIDFVQFAFAACNYKAVIQEYNRVGRQHINSEYIYKSKEYNLSISDRQYATIGGFHKDNLNKTKIIPYKTLDGYKYCFTVSTHMWVSRRNGKITIQGNCGKSSVMYPVVRAFQRNGMEVAQCALSGRAALNLTEITHLQGQTIHKLLSYNIKTGKFDRNAADQLTEYGAIILDETSMVDESLFLSLVKAIPDGCRLILLGDTGQLEPIGQGCVFKDILTSHTFPHIHFTKIFRQAARSGIINESSKVYDGQRILGSKPASEEIRGELKDFKIQLTKDMENIPDMVLKEYKRMMDEYKVDMNDIVVVTSKRSVGSTSCRNLNNLIQGLVNGESTPYDYVAHKIDGTLKYDVTFRPGDKIMVTKNCYTTKDLLGHDCPVFNGNIGVIQNIERLGMRVKFNQGEVLIPNNLYEHIELGYVATCHKMQGSGFKYVITVCDNGGYKLLTKEWLYTAITRAKKFNTLIGQPSAINRACDNASLINKKTLLRDFLVEFAPNFDKIGEE